MADRLKTKTSEAREERANKARQGKARNQAKESRQGKTKKERKQRERDSEAVKNKNEQRARVGEQKGKSERVCS